MGFLINPFWEGEAPPSLPSGLISYYRFNNTATDEVASNDFTERLGFSYVIGKSGNAGQYGGSTYIREAISDFHFTDGSGTDEPFSLSMYVLWDSVSNDWLFNVRENTTTLQEYHLILLSGNLEMWLFSGSTTGNYLLASYAFTPTTSQWYHIVVTYDGSELDTGITIYVDGSDVSATQSTTGTYTGMSNTGSKTILGHAWITDNTKSLAGAVDGLGVWNKELSSAEVTTIYDIQNGGDELV